MSEVIAITTGNLEFAKLGKQRKSTHTWKESKQGKVQDPNRRKILGALAAGLGLAVVGEITRRHLSSKTESSVPPTTDAYKDWEKYQYKSLPREKTLAIGEDLSRDKKYPGFKEIGNLIIITQTNPSQIQRYLPLYKEPHPIDIALTNLIQQLGAIGAFETRHSFFGVTGQIIDKDSGKAYEIAIPKLTNLSSPIVYLDNGFAFAPDAAKKLIIAKEYSHLLYINSHITFLKESLQKKWDIKPSEDIPNLYIHLYYAAKNGLRIEGFDFGEMYRNAYADLDCTAHWHILPAFGQMKDEGLFNSEDLKVLATNNRIFESAKSAGLLIKTSTGYTWKEGIGPFSQEWLNLARPLWKLPKN